MADDRVPTDAPKPETSPRGRRLLRAALVVVTIVVLVDAIVGEKGLVALMRARDQKAAIEQALQAVRLENQRMVEQTRRYREDPATIEELARRDLGMIKPGEKLFIIRDLPAAPPR
ncbi:MAG: septum formation initiator family protein [Vicinamibacterales bacterium]